MKGNKHMKTTTKFIYPAFAVFAFACFALSLTAQAQLPCNQLPEGLVSWWPGNGNAEDIVNGNNGTLVGDVTFAPGPCGLAFDLTGSGYVSVPEAPPFDFGPDDSYTLVAWVYRTGGGDQHFFGKRAGCGGGNDFYQDCICPGGYMEAAIPLQMWTLVAFTSDECSNTSHLWINDQIYATGTATLPSQQNDADFRIGTSGDCQPFNGLLYNMMIFNRALSQAEMTQLYTGACNAVCQLPPAQPCPSPTPTPTPGPCVESPADIVSWWPGDGNALDIQNGNNGTLQNGAAFATGKVGQAFTFDGVNDFIEVPDDPSLRIGDVISIEFWAKRQRFGIDPVVEKGGDWNLDVGDPGANYGTGLHEVNNNMFYFYFKGGWRGADGVSDLGWHHYAVVAIQGQPNPSFYIDGVEWPSLYAGGVSSIDLNAASTLPLYIGAQANDPQGYDYYGNNVIDELAIFNRALSPTEIQAIYNAGSGGKCKGTPTPTPTATATFTPTPTATFTPTPTPTFTPTPTPTPTPQASPTPTSTPTPTPTATPACVAQVQPPINADGSSVWTVKRGVIPVKFTLSCNGNPTCDLSPATIAVTRTAGGVVGEVNESVYTGPSDSGSNFRIDGCQYHYNLTSSALGVGTYRVDILINSQVVGSATFQLK